MPVLFGSDAFGRAILLAWERCAGKAALEGVGLEILEIAVHRDLAPPGRKAGWRRRGIGGSLAI